MINRQELATIKETVKEFFEKMTIPVEVKIEPPREETIAINIKTEVPQVLIGENGQTLLETQRLLKLIIRKKINQTFYIDLDVNGYKKQKIEYLKQLARSTADEVALNKKEKILSPMLAYERRIIHLELAGRENIATESIDQEPERKVIIRPYP